MYKSNLTGATCCEIKTYKYVCAGRNMAEFELLIFEDGVIGTQGEIISTNEKFSPGKLYKEKDIAIQEMINIIEEKIKDDDWIKETSKLI